MIRFRFTEDERRYLRLLAETYRIIARELPPPLVSRVMRNFGKLEQMASLEGVRQGLAVAELSLINAEHDEQDVRGLKAFQAHAVIYGSTDTPLRDVELEWLENAGVPDDTAAGAWLDENPLRFAPQTLSEWEDEQAAEEGAPLDTQPHFSRLQELPSTNGHFSDADGSISAMRSSDYDPLFPDDDVDLPPGLKPEGADSPQERPALLDQIRDVLVGMNPKPATWEDLILHVHRLTRLDAGFLDLQLSTDMGRTVLAQCDIHLHPGAGINLQTMDVSPPAERPPEPDEKDGSAPEDSGANPDGNA